MLKAGDIRIMVPLSDSEVERLLSCVRSAAAKARVAEAATLIAQKECAFGRSALTRAPSPYELNLEFVVPKLAVMQGGTLFDFDSTLLME